MSWLVLIQSNPNPNITLLMWYPSDIQVAFKWHSSGSQVRSRVVVLTTSFFVRTWQLPLYIYEDFFLHIYIEAIAMFEQKKMCSSVVQLPLENDLNTT